MNNATTDVNIANVFYVLLVRFIFDHVLYALLYALIVLKNRY